jgi:hypothetical protein
MKTRLRTASISDTSTEAELVVLGLLRAKSPAEKIKLVCSLNSSTRRLAIAGIKQIYPNAEGPELLRRLADRVLGVQLAGQIYPTKKSQHELLHMNEEAIEITLKVIDVFDRLQVNYLIGGSLASSVYGTIRSTQDADLLADLKTEHVVPLVQALEAEFYIASEAVTEAIKCRTSFNIIHFVSVFKVDVFLPKNRSFDIWQFRNRRLEILAASPERSAYVSSAEDTLLAKLEWYRLGNEVSERQWLDILGIIKVQGDNLNIDYLHERAAELKIADLLEEAYRHDSK